MVCNCRTASGWDETRELKNGALLRMGNSATRVMTVYGKAVRDTAHGVHSEVKNVLRFAVMKTTEESWQT